MISTLLSWLARGHQTPARHTPLFVVTSIARHASWFAAVFVFLAVWRTAAAAHGMLVDGESGLDWIHRTFVMTTVYTCGSTLMCNLMR